MKKKTIPKFSVWHQLSNLPNHTRNQCVRHIAKALILQTKSVKEALQRNEYDTFQKEKYQICLKSFFGFGKKVDWKKGFFIAQNEKGFYFQESDTPNE